MTMMKRHDVRGALLAGACAIWAWSACGDAAAPPDDLGYAGTGVAVSVAPLELARVTDACYSFELRNGDGERVVARGRAASGPVAGHGGGGGPTPALAGAAADPICSSRFGDERGALTYVAPCDASAPAHELTLWVNSVCAGGTGWADADAGGACVPLPGLANPCGQAGCTVAATCVEGADTPVTFELTVMAAAQQGFFDVAVNFDDVFCSAKLDTCHDGDPILLLHDAEGVRQHTAVAAVACTAGAGDVETTLHFTALSVTCGDEQHLLNLGAVTRAGRLAGPANPTLGGLTAAIYYGTEALEGLNKVYTSVAFLLPPGPSCAVDWTIAPSASAAPPVPDDGAHGTYTQVAAVRFDPGHAVVEAGACANFSLDGAGPGAGDGVVTTYLDDAGVTTTSSLTSDSPGFDLGPAFVTVWDTADTAAGSSAADQIRLPLTPEGSYDLLVDWGDGTVSHITSWDQAEVTHTYPAAGEYTVAIWGTLEGWRFGGAGDRAKLQEVRAWGPLRLGDGGSYFRGAANMVVTATDVLDLTGTTSLERAFQDCHALTTVPSMNAWDTSQVTSLASAFVDAWLFDQPIGAWDVSNVTDFGGMFWRAHAFDQPLGGWDTSSALSMSGMFYEATAFDQPIGGWDVSQVTNFTSMFFAAEAFDQDLSAWDTGSATTFHSMFRRASRFNQDIGGWDVSNVEIMRDTFRDASSFDQDVGGWDVSKVTDMSGMFRGAAVFNQDLDGWDVSEVQNMGGMFFHAFAFNGDLSTWDVRKVVSTASMFSGATIFNRDIGGWQTESLVFANRMFYGANLFNQDISGWDVSGVQDMTRMFNDAFRFDKDIGGWDVSGATNMDLMFYRALDFDQDLSGWYVSGVTSMRSMFRDAQSFDRDLGSWDVSSVADATQMLDGSGLSPANYDSLLIGWDSAAGLQADVPLGAIGMTYTPAALDARQGLLSRGWTIDGDAPAP